MNQPKSYSINEVFDNTNLDLTYEFYSSKHTPFIVEQLSEILGKNVVLTGNRSIDGSPLNAILLKEYNSKKPRYQLKTGPGDYKNAMTRNSMTLMWINEHGELNNGTGLRVKLWYNHRELQTLRNISNMDIGKMVLKMDENFLHERFPKSAESTSSMSIKKLIPLGNFINASAVINDMKSVFELPIKEYYGVDFTDYTLGTLTFNYIVGNGYSNVSDMVKEAIDYYVLITYQTLNESDYSEYEVSELRRLTEDYLKLKNLYYNSEKFQEAYPDIKVMTDLNPSPLEIKAKWHMLRDTLFNVMFESGFRKGKFNWDSESGTYQLKDVKLTGTILKGFDLIKCEMNGCILEDIHLWGTKVNNSRLRIGTLISGNKITESHLQNIRADRANQIDKGYIMNHGEIINCKVTDSIIFNAGIGKNAKLDENCTLIEPRDFRPVPKLGVIIEEPRDYKWIKSLGGERKPMEWGNEFKTDY